MTLMQRNMLVKLVFPITEFIVMMLLRLQLGQQETMCPVSVCDQCEHFHIRLVWPLSRLRQAQV